MDKLYLHIIVIDKVGTYQDSINAITEEDLEDIFPALEILHELSYFNINNYSAIQSFLRGDVQGKKSGLPLEVLRILDNANLESLDSLLKYINDTERGILKIYKVQVLQHTTTLFKTLYKEKEETIPSKDIYAFIIEGDINDGDYITEASTITEEQLNNFRSLINLLKEDNKSLGKEIFYREDLVEYLAGSYPEVSYDVVDDFVSCIPYSERYPHTLGNIIAYKIESEEVL